ncbi:MAG: phosphate ABC transporter permease PstA [Armatimonadota bacterium]|jgi:phosphate transport system permease protein
MSQARVLQARASQSVAFFLLWVAAAVVILPVVGIVVVMLIRGARGLTWELVTSTREGLLPAIVGTVCLVGLTAAIAAPLGIAAAVYLSEYARAGPLVRLIRLAIVNLAGVPSVVYGLFGLALFVMMMHLGRSLLAGAATLALLVLPLVISASEEALRQVPRGLREASLGLGASRWQTVRRVVLPNALPGIITGLILSVSRAAGETAPILFTAAFFSLTHPFPRSVFDEILALPYQLFVMTTEVPNVPESSKWATAVVLVAVVLGLNLVAIVIRARLRRARRW